MILPSKSDTTHIETHFDSTGRAEADAFISEIEADGTKASEVLAEIAVKADSANQSSGELADRVKVLEERRGSSGGVFRVRDGVLSPLGGVTWKYWAAGRIYPPAGTYWVDVTAGVTVEKRGNVTESLSFPAVVSFQEGEYLLLLYKQDGQAVRVTPI